MKIALTTSGNDMSAALDSRFGRAARFLMYDTDSDSFTVIDNAQNLNAPQGAGIQSVCLVLDAGAEAVITGHCGPKAFQVLKQAGIAIYQTSAPTVQAALDLFKKNEMQELTDADVNSHWL